MRGSYLVKNILNYSTDGVSEGRAGKTDEELISGTVLIFAAEMCALLIACSVCVYVES
jgi:hypothetical protein